MICCGSLFCADVMSVACTPTDINNITRAELSDGMYDDLRATHNVTEELSSEVKQEWDWDTILHAKFNNNTSAGNVDWDLDRVSYLLIKRKKVSEFKWITLEAHETKTIEDFNLRNIDITATPNYEYQYAAVPIINGVEGFYSIDTAKVLINSLFIGDRDEVWCTDISDNYLDNVSQVPQQSVVTMYDRYPTIVRNTAANYEEITVNAQFFPTEEDGCTINLDGDEQKRVDYNNRAKMFLRNENTKVLKSMDGNIWLVYVTTPPQDTAVDDYKNRKITFTCTEVGDINDEEDLYEAGLITAESQWWN